jgi:4-hydroxybenzoate polyprenyltransferase
MLSILNLIRWKNLLMIAFTQLLIKYAFLEPFGVKTSLDDLGITLLIFATLCIASAGNIINDINDVETDFINKPEKLIVGNSISEKTAYNLFIVLNLIGVGIGFYLSHAIGKAPFFTIFVLISALLYVYATYLKRTFLVGNIIISILVALSLIIVGVFELLPSLTSSNRQTQLLFFKVIFDYSVFAFLINLLREIAKDIEDIDGDYKAGMNTLPIVLGRERAKNILSVLNFIPLAAIIYYVISDLYKQPVAVGYFLLAVIGPLIYITIKTFSGKSKQDFHHISNMYKLVLCFGMLSLLLYKYVILN